MRFRADWVRPSRKIAHRWHLKVIQTTYSNNRTSRKDIARTVSVTE